MAEGSSIPPEFGPPTRGEHIAAHKLTDKVNEGRQGQAVRDPIDRFEKDLPVMKPVRDAEGNLIDVTSLRKRFLHKLTNLGRRNGIKPARTTDGRHVLVQEDKHPNHGFMPKFMNDKGQYVNIYGTVLPELPSPVTPEEPSEKVINEIIHPKRLLVPQEDPDNIQVKKWDELPDDVPETAGQRLQVHTANRENFGMGKTVISYSGDYGNIHGEGESQERLFIMAQRLKDCGLIAINPPQLGDSDKLTPEQRFDIYNQVAHAELRLMKQLGVEIAVFAGQSQGAEIELLKALHAHEYGIAVQDVIPMELPEDSDTLRLLLNSFKEANASLLWESTRGNTRFMRAAGLLKSPWEQFKNNLKFQKRVLTKSDPFLRYGRALAHPHHKDYIKHMLTEQVGNRQDFGDARIGDFINITFVNGSESTVSPLERVNPMVEELRNFAGGRFAGNINQIILRGSGHLAMIDAETNAAIIKQVVYGEESPLREEIALTPA